MKIVHNCKTKSYNLNKINLMEPWERQKGGYNNNENNVGWGLRGIGEGENKKSVRQKLWCQLEKNLDPSFYYMFIFCNRKTIYAIAVTSWEGLNDKVFCQI